MPLLLLSLFLAGPAPPCAAAILPADPSALEPAVSVLVAEVAAAVDERPREAAAWGRLAMAYEANNLWSEARSAYACASALAPEDPGWSFHLALAARETGDGPASLARLRELVAAHPGHAPARQRLGEALLEAGDLAGARAAYERLTELEPLAAQGFVGLAEVELREGRFAAAIGLLERALALDPGYGVARYLLGLALRGSGRPDEAARELAAGAGAAVRYLADPLAEEVRGFAVHLTARLAGAAELLARGRAAEAAELLEAALAGHPDNLTVLNNLAIAWMRAGDPERARTVLLRARDLDERRFSTYLNLASCALRLGRPEEALSWADEAVARAPDQAAAHASRAGILASSGSFAAALESAERAVALDPSQPGHLMMVGDLGLRLGRLDRAAGAFEAAAALAPQALPAWLGLVRARLGLGRDGEAAEALARARELAPEHPAVVALERRLTERRRP